MKKLTIIIILAAGIAVGIYFQKQPKSQELETKARTDAEQAGADVKADEKKIDAVAAQIKADAQKVGEVTTNVVGEIKGKLP